MDRFMPLRLGYFLELLDVTFFDMPGCYRGVDRLWFTPAIDDDGTMPEVSNELRDIWDRYFDADFENELHVNRSMAQSLAAAFVQFDVPVEIIYTEILSVPGDVQDWTRKQHMLQAAEYWYAIHSTLGRRPREIQLLGYDVSLPFPTFHSALFQPGLDKESLSLPAMLNTHGLLATAEDAVQVCNVANEMDYGPYPFCVLGVWILDQNGK